MWTPLPIELTLNSEPAVNGQPWLPRERPFHQPQRHRILASSRPEAARQRRRPVYKLHKSHKQLKNMVTMRTLVPTLSIENIFSWHLPNPGLRARGKPSIMVTAGRTRKEGKSMWSFVTSWNRSRHENAKLLVFGHQSATLHENFPIFFGIGRSLQ